jgi:hypothetical protein
MSDLYTTLSKHGLTTSRRHFSTHWCGKAPNYMAVSGHPSTDVAITVFRKLIAEGRWFVALRVAHMVLFGRKGQR